MKMETNQAKRKGSKTPNRQGLYARAAKHATLAIDTLVELLNCNNENVRLGAAKALLDKCLPDLKASDLSILEEKKPIPIMGIYSDLEQNTTHQAY